MKYAITMKDGSIRIMNLINGDVVSEYNRWIDGPDVVSYKEISELEIPTDRVFRNAWTLDAGAIKEDKVKSQQIIRDKRDAALLKLDVEAFAEGRKPGGDLAAIDAEAQRLRDVPQDPRFNSSDINDLKALIQEI